MVTAGEKGFLVVTANVGTRDDLWFLGRQLAGHVGHAHGGSRQYYTSGPRLPSQLQIITALGVTANDTAW